MCQAFVVDYPGLLAARFFLCVRDDWDISDPLRGLTEGGLLPGLVLFLSSASRLPCAAAHGLSFLPEVRP